jgi:hypothetical protein
LAVSRSGSPGNNDSSHSGGKNTPAPVLKSGAGDTIQLSLLSGMLSSFSLLVEYQIVSKKEKPYV